MLDAYPICPACGNPIDYCTGHGVSGDPAGWSTLNAHDNGDHSLCHEAASCASGSEVNQF